ncbi:MAG: Rieske 2Fe-2S domain-containing protein [Acidimicrobiia bacterium]
MILANLSDDLALRKLQAAAGEIGTDVIRSESITTWDQTEGLPTAVVVDLGNHGWEQLVAESKSRWPLAMVVGILSIPDRETWARAEDAGCDLVTTRGAMKKTLPARLEIWRRAPGGRRLRLFAVDDIAGRLGLVMRLDDEATGPIAVYHIGNDILAVQDLCPHAGAVLSNGEVNVDDGIVTCPEHGSRFDTRTGERMRGPADLGVATFEVVVEDGQAYLRLGPGWENGSR